MAAFGNYDDIGVEIGDDFVATVEIQRGPNNFFDINMIGELADALLALDDEPSVRVSVLCTEGKNFCAGANFGGDRSTSESGKPLRPGHLYQEAVRLFSNKKPVVGAIQGAAVGGGLGLALYPDFRVAAPEARFTANFARLGFHHGFGLSATLPRLVGQQMALELLYTGRRVKGDEAVEIGLADRLAPLDELRDATHAFAREIAISSPLAIPSIRETMRGDFPELIQKATDRERQEQDWLQKTDDFKEGVRAMSERRDPDFSGS